MDINAVNPLLKGKLDFLRKENQGRHWYIVKQETSFVGCCYLVKFLKEFKECYEKDNNQKIEDFIKNRVHELNARNPSCNVTSTWRALRIAAYYGLIIMKSPQYKDAIITDVFNEIVARCGGKFEKRRLYDDIIQRQIEKIYISSSIDSEYNRKRKDFNLYPVMLTYKVLIELGKSTGEYSISMDEFNYFLLTTETYEDFLDTLLQIKLFRNTPKGSRIFRDKNVIKGEDNKDIKCIDSRFDKILKELSTLTVSDKKISLNKDSIEKVENKLLIFEKNPKIHTSSDEEYIKFLCSSRSLFDKENIGKMEIKYNTGISSKYSRNRILFGAPGTGKSYMIEEERKELLGEGINSENYERVTFYPDYSYANFVGTYKPVPYVKNNGEQAITYTYVPGPFMRVYVNALKSGMTDNPKPYLLIVEEINRAQVAAVFGDVFQLLDRDEDGVSEYHIQASEDVKNYLSKELGGSPDLYSDIKIPDNMFIWATMNSADQGVYPMDTAFKRRWDFTYLGIDDNEENIKGKYVRLNSEKVEWNSLRKSINDYLAEERIDEDKQLGPYFLSKNIIIPKEGNEIDSEKFVDAFKNKIIMYLFEDAAKSKRARMFEGCHPNNTRYSDICKSFDKMGIDIFNSKIVNMYKSYAPDSNDVDGTDNVAN